MRQITKLTTGPLVGFAWLPANAVKLLQYVNVAMERGIRYGFGTKDPVPGKWPIDYTEIDCSGFVRTALHYATNGDTAVYGFPDGSANQHDWLDAQGFKKTDYSMCANVDSHVRVAVHAPNGRGGDPIGHIWLIYQGKTIESFGGHGPGRRAWDHQWFLDHVDACYVLS